MTNAQIADAFDQIADLLEFQGANPFRVRAYRNGARTIRDYPEPLAAIVGERVEAKLDRHRRHRRGPGGEDRHAGRRPAACRMLEELQAQVPESVLALLRIPGLGPKKAAALHKELGIKTLDDLQAACEAAQVREPEGLWREDRAEPFCRASASPRRPTLRMLLGRGRRDRAVRCARTLRSCKGVEQLEFAGSYRRGKETVGDLDILVVADDPTAAMDRLATFRRDWRESIAPRRHEDVGPHCHAACRSTCASCPPSRSARRCSTSPARRTTTSSSAALAKDAG